MGKLFGNGRRGLSQDSKAKKGNSSAPVSFKTFPKILLAGSMGFETVSKAYFPKTLVLVHPTSGDQTNPRHQECTLRIYLRANPWRAPIVVERTYALGETAVSIANQFLREPAATAKELNLFEPNNEFLHYNSWRSVEDKSHEIVTEIENSVLDINEDSVFSIGSHFSLLLSSGKNPSTVNGWKNLTNYLQVVPLRIGYFGDFKRIIKSLEGLYTSATDIQIKKYYAGLLGIAFGRVESIMISKSYKVRATIDSNRGWHLDYLRYFAEDINISITPKFATCRYLMNRGLKFMRRIEVENVDHAYLFKINLLQVVDRSYLHINDKDSLPNQWITSEILYGRRHHYSDSTPLNPPAIRHNSDVKLPVFPGNALPNEEFFSSFAGRHPDIFLAWLHTNEALNLSIEWNLDRVSTAFLSRSTDAQNKAWR